jgi:S1-C subfamily serine protease
MQQLLKWTAALGLVLILTTGVALLWNTQGPVLAEQPSAVEGSPVVRVAQSGSGTVLDIETLFSDVYERVAPSVVAIIVRTETASGIEGEGSGSGFVIDRQGHIVTNFHVIDSAEEIEVYFFDGTIAEATVTGTDPESDIAVIQVDLGEDRLQPVTFGNSDDLHVGQFVLAIGNPFGQEWTLTSGIVSALNRAINSLGRFQTGGVIQTDAAINPGNSGGPLLNLAGEVIGVNSQIEFGDRGARQNAGIGFAVPSNLVARVADDLISQGRVDYPFVGIVSRPIDLDLIREFNLPDNVRGVPIRQVVPDGPAATAGIRTLGTRSIDVITAIDGTPIQDFNDMLGYLATKTRPGQTITVTVLRDGQSFDTTLTLASRP